MKTVKNQIMQFFANQFQVKERDNGDTFVCLGDSAPSWCQDVCREVHGGLMPDDWRYSWISLAADSLADIDPDNWEDETHEIADGLIDVYNGRLLSWLASNLSRIGYCDEASENGLPRENDLINMIQAGQYEEISETIQSLVSEIESLADDVEPYAAGFNMCGYMPDSEPVTFPDFESAREYITEEIESREIEERDRGNWGLAEQYQKAGEHAENQTDEFSVTVNHFAFWVSESEEWLQEL
ncbi:hypothetical protein [Marinobacter sp. DS40M6]|uniref:hypothetical protein n=1 Tax=Marinobacter sp. DS40M6 TaxID=1597776 RepID=UPI00235985A4|nr:hypothetical protein [Marinobacter sp. DS40M6]MDC8457857.1 hypothetical protein [Marinobacter sp. DS40M6]